MERLISKLNRPPSRFDKQGFLKVLNKNAREAIIALKESPGLKKAMIVDVLQRFDKKIKSTKFPTGITLVRNGFFIYGGQVIQEVFQQTKKLVDPKIRKAMEMTPSSDYDGQLILKFTKDGKISREENISKETQLKKFLLKTMKYAAKPYGSIFKVDVATKIPYVIDVTLADAETGFDYAEIHAVNGYAMQNVGLAKQKSGYTERGSDRLSQTKCCVQTLKSLGLPVLNLKSLLYDQLFALDSMLTGNSHRKSVRPDKCQQRFVRMTFIYELMKKTGSRIPKEVKMLVKEIVERMDKPKYAKYFKECSVKIH